MAKSSAISRPCSCAAATSRRKSSSVPSSGWIGVVPALLRADRVDAAGIAGSRPSGVVPALAVGAADRMDRREVEDVEAEVLHVGQLRDHVVEGAVAVGSPDCERGNSSYQAENRAARRSAIDLEHAVVAREVPPLGVAVDERRVVGRRAEARAAPPSLPRAGLRRAMSEPQRRRVRLLGAGARPSRRCARPRSSRGGRPGRRRASSRSRPARSPRGRASPRWCTGSARCARAGSARPAVVVDEMPSAPGAIRVSVAGAVERSRRRSCRDRR